MKSERSGIKSRKDKDSQEGGERRGVLMSISAFAKIAIGHRDEIPESLIRALKILIGADLRINQHVDFCSHIFEAFEGGIRQPVHHLIGLSLGFTQLLDVGSK